MPPPRRWTAEQLRAALAGARTLLEVCQRLGIPAGGQTYASVRREAVRLGLFEAHAQLLTPRVRGGRKAWSDDDLRSAVRDSRSRAEVQRRLGYRPSGGIHRYVNAHSRRLGLDPSHFTGQAWQLGKRRAAREVRRALDKAVKGPRYSPSSKLRGRLTRSGLKSPHCEMRGLDSWLGQPIRLELDHINGDPCDNRLVNLRILWSNCHSLTETWCGRRRPA